MASEKLKKSIVVKFIKQFTNAGILFLGGAESVAGVSEDFEIQSQKRGHYYTLKTGAGL